MTLKHILLSIHYNATLNNKKYTPFCKVFEILFSGVKSETVKQCYIIQSTDVTTIQ